ncbi:hypothetical protein ACLB2K_074980 [Fragaria x ananassa]
MSVILISFMEESTLDKIIVEDAPNSKPKLWCSLIGSRNWSRLWIFGVSVGIKHQPRLSFTDYDQIKCDSSSKRSQKPSALAELPETQDFAEVFLISTFQSASLKSRGILGEDGAHLVAVKVFNMLRRGASKSFQAECEALRNIRHRNLVPIITACSSVDSHGNDFKALVYKFMENGSLEEWLHPTTRTEDTPKSLSLVQKVDDVEQMALKIEEQLARRKGKIGKIQV